MAKINKIHNPPTAEFRKRVKIIKGSHLPHRIKDKLFQLAVDLEYDLLPQVDKAYSKKLEELYVKNCLKVFDDELRQAAIIESIIKEWHLT